VGHGGTQVAGPDARRTVPRCLSDDRSHARHPAAHPLRGGGQAAGAGAALRPRISRWRAPAEPTRAIRQRSRVQGLGGTGGLKRVAILRIRSKRFSFLVLRMSSPRNRCPLSGDMLEPGYSAGMVSLTATSMTPLRVATRPMRPCLISRALS